MPMSDHYANKFIIGTSRFSVYAVGDRDRITESLLETAVIVIKQIEHVKTAFIMPVDAREIMVYLTEGSDHAVAQVRGRVLHELNQLILRHNLSETMAVLAEDQ